MSETKQLTARQKDAEKIRRKIAEHFSGELEVSVTWERRRRGPNPLSVEYVSGPCATISVNTAPEKEEVEYILHIKLDPLWGGRTDGRMVVVSKEASKREELAANRAAADKEREKRKEVIKAAEAKRNRMVVLAFVCLVAVAVLVAWAVYV